MASPADHESGAPRAASPEHTAGQSVDTVDQVSSLVLAGMAIAGAAVSILLLRLLVG